MVYRDKGRTAWKIRIHWNGRVFSAGAATTDERTANAIEEFVRTLKDSPEYHAVLDKILRRQMTLARAYTLYKESRVQVALKIKPAVDIVPLIDLWKKGFEGLVISQYQERRSENGYERQIRMFTGGSYMAAEFTAKRIGAYLREMKKSGSTRNRHHTALSVFADFLVDEDIIEVNPLRQVSRYKENPAREVWFDSTDTGWNRCALEGTRLHCEFGLDVSVLFGRSCTQVICRRRLRHGRQPCNHPHGSL